MKRRRARIDRDGMATAQVRGEVFFESLNLGPGGQPSRAESFHYRFDLGIANFGDVEWHEFAIAVTHSNGCSLF
jgi:hypothetical protein